jgi:hypothetical protein
VSYPVRFPAEPPKGKGAKVADRRGILMSSWIPAIRLVHEYKEQAQSTNLFTEQPNFGRHKNSTGWRSVTSFRSLSDKFKRASTGLSLSGKSKRLAEFGLVSKVSKYGFRRISQAELGAYEKIDKK